MEKMSIEQALANVDVACASFAGNRQQHSALIESLQMIGDALGIKPQAVTPIVKEAPKSE